MTLRKKLMEKRNSTITEPIKTAEEIWQCIYEEFASFTGRELGNGNAVYMDLEQFAENLCLRSYVSNEGFDELSSKDICIKLDKEWVRNKGIDAIMKEIGMMAEKEGVVMRKEEEDAKEKYSVWTFEINFE